jgi:hypothetical protein
MSPNLVTLLASNKTVTMKHVSKKSFFAKNGMQNFLSFV